MGHTNLPVASDQTFGDVLRTLRRASGLTQAELAERTNLSTRGLSDLERGINHAPRRETLLALADAFGLADVERVHFFAAAGRRPAPAPVSTSPPSATSAESKPVLAAPPPLQTFLIADMRGYTSLLPSMATRRPLV